MRGSLAIGVILMLLGGAILAWPVISYTDRDKVVDLGPLEITTEDEEHVALPPILGGVAIAAGLALVLLSGRRRAG